MNAYHQTRHWLQALHILLTAILLAGPQWPSTQMPAAQAAGEFTSIATALANVYYSAVAWGDYDSDSDLDIVLTGCTTSTWCTTPVSRIYRNDGGAFTDINAALTEVSNGATAWGDYDNDGDLDLLLTGTTDGSTGIAKIYRNDGGGVFTDINASLQGVWESAVAWGDYDNDGDLDIGLLGCTSNCALYLGKVYRNDGNGIFTDTNAPLASVVAGSLAWGDYDNDGDDDLLLTGFTNQPPSPRIAKIYRNDGGSFVDINALPFGGGDSAAWGDFDNDGDLDVVAAGSNNAAFVTQVYRNDGGSVFTDIGAALANLSSGRVAWGDYDNDGDLDLLLAGLDAAFQRIAEVYRNDGGLFTEIGAGLIGVFNHSMAWGDYDNDDDLDFLLTGCNAPTANGCTYYISFLYRNNTLIPNTLPTAPSGLGASVEGTIATLHWNPASDVQTPASGLTYNLRVGTTPGGGEIVSPQAITATGCRLLPQFGNVSHGLTATLTNLSPGVYYWSAQAIDSTWAGSAFATGGSFTLPPPPPPTPIPGDLYLPLIQRASDNPVAPGC